MREASCDYALLQVDEGTGLNMTFTKWRPSVRFHEREFMSWVDIRQRCHNPNNYGYHKYGGRGIFVCERWRMSFMNFLLDMGSCPAGKSIERIDNNGPYEPGNCRWATPKEQACNTRRTRLITYNGITLCMKDWARHLGIAYSTFQERIAKWPIEKALSLPPQKEQRRGN